MKVEDSQERVKSGRQTVKSEIEESEAVLEIMNFAKMIRNEVCIVSMARTPMASFGGAYKGLSAVQLGVISTKAALHRSKV